MIFLGLLRFVDNLSIDFGGFPSGFCGLRRQVFFDARLRKLKNIVSGALRKLLVSKIRSHESSRSGPCTEHSRAIVLNTPMESFFFLSATIEQPSNL